MDAHVISLANQKGGTAKTTTCANLGIGLAQAGRKVLLVDADAQGSLTLSLGWEPDELPITLYDLMIKAIQDKSVTHGEGMLHHEEGGGSPACQHRAGRHGDVADQRHVPRNNTQTGA